ncbi:MAG TPA: hypothetical protein VND93_16025 [Myxococcales bacterium]|jgi:hypothetical protein|nr:hypothetical protein [Myxococcales bacterium]
MSTQERPRFVALFDCSPAESPPWVRTACVEAGLFFVDNDDIATQMSKSQEAQKAILELNQGFRENEAMAPHYSAALDKVAGGQDRLAVYSVSWFLYGVRPAVAILDFQPLEDEVKKARAGPKKVPEEKLQEYLKTYRTKLTDLALGHVGQERTLILPLGMLDSQKAALAAEHIKKHLTLPPDPNLKFKSGVRG